MFAKQEKHMNKVFFAIVGTLFLTSCANTFNISGTSNVSTLDGRMLYLKVIQDNELANLDSCDVLHGQFRFGGPLDSVQVAHIFMDDENVMPVVLEGGKIQVRLDDTQMTVTGTPLNEALTEYSQEIKKQLLEKEGRDYPDYLVACIGGGSNAGGTIFHYLDDERAKIILAEAGGLGLESGKTAASILLGKPCVLHGSRTLVIQDGEGNVMEPYSISAGLDYPGIGPLHACLAKEGRAQVLAVNDGEALQAAYELTRMEGIVPALESSHALAVLGKVRFNPQDVVVLTVSGRGDKDMDTYIQHMEA